MDANLNASQDAKHVSSCGGRALPLGRVSTALQAFLFNRGRSKQRSRTSTGAWTVELQGGLREVMPPCCIARVSAGGGGGALSARMLKRTQSPARARAASSNMWTHVRRCARRGAAAREVPSRRAGPVEPRQAVDVGWGGRGGSTRVPALPDVREWTGTGHGLSRHACDLRSLPATRIV